MNAHKFVAEHGIDEAKRVLIGAPDWAIFWISRDQYHGHIISFPNMTGHYSIKLSELRQVVESLDTIDRLFGLDQAKHTMKIAKEIGYSSDYEQIKQAIEDYEHVESYKQVKCEVLDMVDVSPNCKKIGG